LPLTIIGFDGKENPKTCEKYGWDKMNLKAKRRGETSKQTVVKVSLDDVRVWKS